MRVNIALVLAAVTALTPSVAALTPSAAAAFQTSPAPTTVGLALSGGSAKGIAHIGVIRALERLGVRVDVVAGTSMGSVVGGLYSMGLPVDSVESIIRGADWSALLGDAVARDRRFLDQRRFDERAILSVPLRDLSVSIPTGAIVGSNVIRLLEVATWEAAGVRRFRELPRPFVAVATDLETGEAVALRGGVLSEALRASTGIPAVIEPLTIDGRLLVDGALSRNLPAADARELGADFVICSDVSDPLESAEDLESLFDVFSQVTSLSMLAANTEQRQLCDVLIRPDVDGISPLAFEEVEDWVMRGDTSVAPHEIQLRALAAAAPSRGQLPRPADFFMDSVRIEAINIGGTLDPKVTGLVRSELELEDGEYVDRMGMESRLGDLDATGLFRLVRYRLDRRSEGAILTVTVEERPRDRLGLGLRYDDEWRAALLFTATLHNVLTYGSVTRLDLRVGEETRIGATLTRRRGVTGRLGTGFAAHWSQGELDLPPLQGGRSGVELSTASLSFGWAAARGTAVSFELGAERAVYDIDAPDVLLLSGAAVLHHETLDRIDFPRSGAGITSRFEWGGTDITGEDRFTHAMVDGRFFLPLHGRVTLDLGVWLGYQKGGALPLHRRFFLGGVHPSAVFATTHATFQGLPQQEHSGSAVQVARLGVRWRAGGNTFLRAGTDVGGVRDGWQFPMERPMTGWALSAGTGTLVGPIEVELAKLWGERHDPRLSVSVGRRF